MNESCRFTVPYCPKTHGCGRKMMAVISPKTYWTFVVHAIIPVSLNASGRVTGSAIRRSFYFSALVLGSSIRVFLEDSQDIFDRLRVLMRAVVGRHDVFALSAIHV